MLPKFGDVDVQVSILDSIRVDILNVIFADQFEQTIEIQTLKEFLVGKEEDDP